MTDPIRVDLKWSLWSRDEDTWDDYAPGVWATLAALEPEQEIAVRTAPKNEVRYGSVTTSRDTAGKWFAAVLFREEWDCKEDLANALNVPEDLHAAFFEEIPRHAGEPGVAEEAHVGPFDTFAALMGAVDDVEVRLIEGARASWDAVATRWRHPTPEGHTST